MWISRRRYETLMNLQERVQKLEDAVWVPAAGQDRIGRVVHMLLDHLGLNYRKVLEHAKLEKKGGPEHG